MGNSSLVVYAKPSPNRTSPRNHRIDTITIHCMAADASVESCGALFAQPRYSTDNAMGVAILTWLALERGARDEP